MPQKSQKDLDIQQSRGLSLRANEIQLNVKVTSSSDSHRKDTNSSQAIPSLLLKANSFLKRRVTNTNNSRK